MIGDHSRDAGALGEVEHGRAGGTVGRRDQDAIDLARDCVLRVLQLCLRIVVAVIGGRSAAGCLGLIVNSLRQDAPKRQVQPWRQVGELSAGRACRRRASGERSR
jgi:hypothetical protein